MFHVILATRSVGQCLDPNGVRETEGQVYISGNYTESGCIKACWNINVNATGCEHRGGSGYSAGECAYHRLPLSKGDGNPKDTCWVFNKGLYS